MYLSAVSRDQNKKQTWTDQREKIIFVIDPTIKQPVSHPFVYEWKINKKPLLLHHFFKCNFQEILANILSRFFFRFHLIPAVLTG